MKQMKKITNGTIDHLISRLKKAKENRFRPNLTSKRMFLEKVQSNQSLKIIGLH